MAASCFVDGGQLFRRSRTVVWSIAASTARPGKGKSPNITRIDWSMAASCLVDRGQLFGRSRTVVWSIAASCLVYGGQLFGRLRPLFSKFLT
jgi:hypothetical protein